MASSASVGLRRSDLMDGLSTTTFVVVNTNVFVEHRYAKASAERSDGYDCRSAVRGSMRVARSRGTAIDNSDTAPRTAVTATHTTRPVALTPNSSPAIRRDTAAALPRPTRIPTSGTNAPRRG